MERSGNMYVLNGRECIRAKKFSRPAEPLEDVRVPGPCMVRLENIVMEPSLGLLVLSVQIGFERGREYLVADTFESVVFSGSDCGTNPAPPSSPAGR